MTLASDGSSSVSEVDTFGWDTAYIASYRVVNDSIRLSRSYPTAFAYTDNAGIQISGVWALWQLTPGGGGGDVQMACTVTSGSISLGTTTGDLAGATVIIEVNLEKVAAAEHVDDPTGKPGTGTTHNLVVKTTGSNGAPAVSVLGRSTYPALTDALLLDVVNTTMAGYFNANIDDFNHTFAVMDINVIADQDGFQWIKPTDFSYAVAQPSANPTIDNCAFGVISMVENHPIQPFQEQAIDSRALANLPAGANAAFVISEQMVAQNILLNGAVSAIQGSSAADFDFSSDGKSVTNNKSLTWGNFQTSNGIISPVITTGNFILRADDTYVYVEISEATYEPSEGITVEMNLTQKFTFSTVQREDGGYVFIPDITGLGSPDVKTNVSLSKGLQITHLITGIVAGVAGLLVAASGIGALIAESADVAVDAAAESAEVAIDGAQADAIADANPAELAEENQEGADNADEGAENPADPAQVQEGGIFTSMRFRIALGIISACAGLTAGGIGVAKYIVSKDYDEIPSFDDFAANCLGASVWPQVTGYTLLGAGFQQSLVLGIQMVTAPEA